MFFVYMLGDCIYQFNFFWLRELHAEGVGRPVVSTAHLTSSCIPRVTFCGLVCRVFSPVTPTPTLYTEAMQLWSGTEQYIAVGVSLTGELLSTVQYNTLQYL